MILVLTKIYGKIKGFFKGEELFLTGFLVPGSEFRVPGFVFILKRLILVNLSCKFNSIRGKGCVLHNSELETRNPEPGTRNSEPFLPTQSQILSLNRQF